MKVIHLISRLMELPSGAEVEMSFMRNDGHSRQLSILRVSVLGQTVYLECGTSCIGSVRQDHVEKP